MPLSSSVAFKELTDQNPIGTRFGVTSSDVICFYGATSAVGAATVIGANSATTNIASQSATTASVTTWGYASSTQANAISAAVNQLFLMGIIK